MLIALNRTGSNLTLLGYSSKREYFGEAVSFRKIETYNYEYTTLDLANVSSGLSQKISADISGQIGSFSGNVNIRALDIPAAYDIPQDQIRTAKYNVTLEVRQPITSITDVGNSGYYTGIDYVRNAYLQLNNFSENFSFENSEDSQSINHSINFELRTGDKDYAQLIASGIMQTSEPGSFGIGVLSGYMGVYDDASSLNYYTESYDSFKNSYSFSKKKNLYKLSSLSYTFTIDTNTEFSDGIMNVSDSMKVKGKKTFSQASAGLDTLISLSYTRASSAFDTYKNFSNIAASSSLFSNPLKTVKKYNVPGLAAECNQTFTNNPLYKDVYKQDQTLSLNKDINGTVTIDNQYNFTYLKNITDDSTLTGVSYFTPKINSGLEVSGYYSNNGFSQTLSELEFDAKSSRRSRNYSLVYKYSDDPRYNVTLSTIAGSGVTFKNVDCKFSDNKPKDNITEYKVINKPQTLINYAYQQQAGSKSVTLTAIRARPTVNQLTNFSLPSSEMNALYTKSLNVLIQNFTSLVGLNYYLSNLSFSINNENKIELSSTINYTNKKYG